MEHFEVRTEVILRMLGREEKRRGVKGGDKN
jgi:hypothetical protein